PDWLEDNLGPQHTAPISTRAAGQMVDQLAREPGKWLSDLGKVTDAGKFSTLCQSLELAIPVLSTRREVGSLWRISSVLRMMAGEGATKGERAIAADRALKVLQDPAVLAPAAEDLLHGPEASREARGLLLASGVAGAYALYGARVRALG